MKKFWDRCLAGCADNEPESLDTSDPSQADMMVGKGMLDSLQQDKRGRGGRDPTSSLGAGITYTCSCESIP